MRKSTYRTDLKTLEGRIEGIEVLRALRYT